MRYGTIILSLLCFLYPALAGADYNDGLHDYLRGRYTQAFQELSPLARNGDAQAQYLLGSMFANGNGVKKNLVRAHALFSLAAAQGHDKATLYKEEISWDMSADQIAESKNLATQWQSKMQEAEKPAPVSQQTIASIQKRLQELGHYSGTIDGLTGPRTERSIRRYQQAQGLPQSGKPTQALLEHLQETFAEQPFHKLLSTLPEGPWNQVLLHEDFADGEYTSNPSWSGDSGAFQVDSKHVLRTNRPLPEADQATADQEKESTAQKIFGAVVKEVMGPKQTTQEPSFSSISTAVHFGPVFALRMEIELPRHQKGQRFAFGPFLTQSRKTGYRLSFTERDRQYFSLIRIGQSGSSIIDIVRNNQLLPIQKKQSITWLRFEDGSMEVHINKTPVLKTRDKMYEDFAGITFCNYGGTYHISSISVFGPEDNF